jgi:2-desacetyl-2-hydroxyethyl bacteriochlorophyllide A dehydrogenase
MKAAVLTETGKIEIKEVPPPEPGPGEVAIQVTLAGICGSDNTLFQGGCGVPLPVIPGHEAIGRIKKIGEGVSGLDVGQRVTIQPNFACGSCPVCQSGYPNICPSKIRLGIDSDGVFADYVKVPASYVWPIPEGLADEVAVMTEPLAVAVHAMNRVLPGKGDRTLIFGAGLIGLLTLQLAALHGAEVTACDLEESRLSLAKELGASQVMGAKDPFETFHNTFDVIYETSGSAAALAKAIQLAAPRGKIVMLGLPKGESPIPAAVIVRKELQIVGSMIYDNEFPQALELLANGQLQIEPLISARLPLSELNNAMNDFSSPTRVKTLLVL